VPLRCYFFEFVPSRDGLVGIVTVYKMDAQGSIPGSPRDSCLLHNVQAPIQWEAGALSLEVKRPDREADHSPTSIAEVEEGGAMLPFPHTSSLCDA
jgi:hypothetical protein